MTVDPFLIGIVAAILAGVMAVFMPVSRHRVNQTIVSVIIVVLIFVAAFAFLDIPVAIPVAIVVSAVVIGARFVLGGLRTAIYHNVTRYTRRDYWQRKVGQSIIGGNSRGRRRNGD